MENNENSNSIDFSDSFSITSPNEAFSEGTSACSVWTKSPTTPLIKPVHGPHYQLPEIELPPSCRLNESALRTINEDFVLEISEFNLDENQIEYNGDDVIFGRDNNERTDERCKSNSNNHSYNSNQEIKNSSASTEDNDVLDHPNDKESLRSCLNYRFSIKRYMERKLE